MGSLVILAPICGELHGNFRHAVCVWVFMKQAFSLIAGLLLPFVAHADPSPKELRVLCWNLHHGAGMDGKNDLERIAAVIRSQNPDVVLLQEVDKNCGRSNRVDQAAELGRLLEMHSAFGKAMDHDGGEYGQAILSRTEIEDAEVHRLPSQGEPRIAFSATVDSPMGRVTVASVHLDYQDEARQFAQAQVAAAALLKSPHPVVLAGDFNATPESRTLSVFAQAPWNSLAKESPVETHPADAPKVEIDHVVTRGLRGVRPPVVVAEAVASDHRPLLAVLALPE